MDCCKKMMAAVFSCFGVAPVQQRVRKGRRIVLRDLAQRVDHEVFYDFLDYFSTMKALKKEMSFWKAQSGDRAFVEYGLLTEIRTRIRAAAGDCSYNQYFYDDLVQVCRVYIKSKGRRKMAQDNAADVRWGALRYDVELVQRDLDFPRLPIRGS